PDACAGVFTRARAAAPRALSDLGIDAGEASAFQCMAGALVDNDNSWRADAATIAKAEGGAPPSALAIVAASARQLLSLSTSAPAMHWNAEASPASMPRSESARGAAARARVNTPAQASGDR